jgi:hypothetical protein
MAMRTPAACAASFGDRNHGKRFQKERVRPGSDGTTCMAPIPALGVRPRTVGDFCVPSVHREGVVGVPPTTFNGNRGLLRLIG